MELATHDMTKKKVQRAHSSLAQCLKFGFWIWIGIEGTVELKIEEKMKRLILNRDPYLGRHQWRETLRNIN